MIRTGATCALRDMIHARDSGELDTTWWIAYRMYLMALLVKEELQAGWFYAFQDYCEQTGVDPYYVESQADARIGTWLTFQSIIGGTEGERDPEH